MFMRDQMLSPKEVDQFMNIVNEVDEFCKMHLDQNNKNESIGVDPNFGKETLERVYVMSFEIMLRDLVKSCSQIKSLLAISREHYRDVVTDNGNRDLDLVAFSLFMQMECASKEDQELIKSFEEE